MVSTTEPIKGAGTSLWIYNGTGNPYTNPQNDTGWTRLAKIKDLTPGELTAESFDDTYLDDATADWASTAQGQKSAGDASFTLAWKPGESGQQDLVNWFDSGEVRAYKIKYPNGAVDVFKGWVSSLGKSIPVKEIITRTVKVTNAGKPALAEQAAGAAVAVTGLSVSPASLSVVVGSSSDITVTISPNNASDSTFNVGVSDSAKTSASVSGSVITVTGVAVGSAEIVVMTNDGKKTGIIPVTVTAS
ncbi:phage tail tube protein [Dickeya fangzhongdai]|uniref:phage tail tube protein n=1 Tax=Dickeya fangzhongdai TaxID=1778540 RepID=UPI001ADBD2EB|nr:phage tail tube protein [Dickeya fangzhongdai]MBO8132458.1 Ig-like domain-containing protein [Dickeya fangzhongdai]